MNEAVWSIFRFEIWPIVESILWGLSFLLFYIIGWKARGKRHRKDFANFGHIHYLGYVLQAEYEQEIAEQQLKLIDEKLKMIQKAYSKLNESMKEVDNARGKRRI